MTKSIGMIGFGNMARALAQGWLRTETVAPQRILATARDFDKLTAHTKPHGFQPVRTVAELIERADIVVVAIKPYQVEAVLSPHKEALAKKIVVSVAAGWDFDRYEAFFAPGTRHVSIIPNTPVAAGEGVVLIERKHSLPEEAFGQVRALLEAIAVVEQLDEDVFDAGTVISGCGPAFVAMFIEALADGGVKHGLPRETAYRLASQTLVGTGALQLSTGEHPGRMKDAVCSPGGTTIRGVAALEREGLRNAVICAVDDIMNA